MILLDHTHTLKTKTTPFSIFPFACVHEDNEGHSKERWQEFLREVRITPNALAIGLGDYMDWLRTHARMWLKAYDQDGGSKNSFDKMHDWRRKAADEFCEKYLDPIRDKLIGLSLGNHHHEFDSGYNDTMYMCEQLKVPYLGKGFFVRLGVKIPSEPSSHTILKILGHHGEGIGGGATMGGDVNAMENKIKGWESDIYIFAHNHKKHGFHTNPVTINPRGRLRLKEVPKAFIRAGCFMRGYVEKCVTYAEAKGLMNPTSIGYVRLDVSFKFPHNPEKHLRNKRDGRPNRNRSDALTHDFKVTY